MIGDWMTVNATITRIWTETGVLYGITEVRGLSRRTGRSGLRVEDSHEHTRVLERSVNDHIAWLNASKTKRPASRRSRAGTTRKVKGDSV
ncbi:hypothetical protein [Nonomuraea sp. NPDC050643]|uniref:hypothetical protein n=1 Tax=Nonomuraea sp. NPDC050643 TaxID=3155660 RepID=UPI00340DC291